ncbi:MAG: hypothetical protein B0A82_02695 [Alkalinema sp. CACIAM 70d]|nr:MAG: hypothetical protein B0A82_02695 [Alkalinema sp. CACIAM 70d]
MLEDAITLEASQTLLRDIQKYLDFIEGNLGGEESVSQQALANFVGIQQRIETVGIIKPKVIVPLPITGDTYKVAKLDIPIDINTHLKKYAYYYLPVPITLFHSQVRKRGLRFRRLEVRFSYNLESPDTDKPLSHDLFPGGCKWQTILEVQQESELVISGGLNFELQTPNLGQALISLTTANGLSNTVNKLLLPNASASAGGSGKSQTRIRWSPIQYVQRRLLNEGKGIGQPFAFWSFQDLDTIESDEELILHVVLQVPRHQRNVTVMPLILVDFDYVTLESQWRGMIESLQKYLANIKELFGNQAMGDIEKFMHQLDCKWPLIIGGDKAWNLSDDMVH